MAHFTPQEIEQFLQEFFDVVGTRQYTGARYVPIFGRKGEYTIEWDNLGPYEPLTVVMHQGISYVSKRYVPKDIDILDPNYWAETYRFNAQVEQYRQEVLQFQSQIDQLRDDLELDYVPFPDSAHYPKFGTLGQVLTTLADGETRWEDPVVPSDEQAEEVITTWLNAHPEATTTVQDNAITDVKLNNNGIKNTYNYRRTVPSETTLLSDLREYGVYPLTPTTLTPITDLPSGALKTAYYSMICFPNSLSGSYITQFLACHDSRIWVRIITNTGSIYHNWDLICIPNISTAIENAANSVSNALSNRIEMLRENVIDRAFSIITKNGYYISMAGNETSYNTAIRTEWFPVKENETYEVNSCAFYGAAAYVIKNSSGTVIEAQNVGQSEVWQKFIVTIPVNGALMACSSTKRAYFYVKRINTNISGNIGLYKQSNLTYKKWHALGDSFTHGDFTGTDTPYISGGLCDGFIATYPALIASQVNAFLTNSAVNGGTIAESGTSGRYALSRNGNYNSIPEDADYVSIMIGINDSGLNIPIGTIDSTDNTTFYGAWNVVLSWLRNNRPNTKVGIIISLSLNPQYREAEIAVTKKYGYAYLNLPEDETLPLFLYCARQNVDSTIQTLVNTQQRISANNFHPNAETHKKLATVIGSWLETI